MQPLPILKLASPSVADPADIVRIDAYRPLVAEWVLRMALECGWYRAGDGKREGGCQPRRFSLRGGHVLSGEGFQALTGLRLPGANEDKDEQLVTAAQLKHLIEVRLREVAIEPSDAVAPLFRNLGMLAERIGLTEPEQALLAFAVLLKQFPRFSEFVGNRALRMDRAELAALMATLCGYSRAEFDTALGQDSTLTTNGLFRVSEDSGDLQDILQLSYGVSVALISERRLSTLVSRWLPSPAQLPKAGKVSQLVGKDRQTPAECGIDAYRSLVAEWVLRMALECGWYRESGGTRERGRRLRRFSLRDGHVLLGVEFQALTGLQLPAADESEDERLVTASQLKRLLEVRLREVASEHSDADTPLFRNLGMLAEQVGLTQVEQALLAFAILLAQFPHFWELVSNRALCMDRTRLAALMEALCGYGRSECYAALGREATLATTGLLRLSEDEGDLQDILQLPDGGSVSLISDWWLSTLVERWSPSRAS